MNAEEARKITVTGTDNLNRVLYLIEKAALNGKYETIIYSHVYEVTANQRIKLRQLGYKVTTVAGSATVISWK